MKVITVSQPQFLKCYKCFMQKGFVPILALVGILVIAAVAGGAYYLSKVKTPESRICAMDVKTCPDGSSVGRSGPNCEFSPCPKSSLSPTPSDETSNWKTYRNEKEGYSIKYPPKWIFVKDSLFDGNVIGSIKSPQESNNVSQLKIEIHSGNLSYERYAYFY